MNLTIIMISIIVIIFGTGFLYQKILSSKSNKKSNGKKEQSNVTTLAQSNFSEKITTLTSIEKETAIKVLEKLGYQKNDIIKLLGADIYD